MANNPVAIRPVMTLPTTKDIASTMSSTLDAYTDSVEVIKTLTERRDAKRDEFLKYFLAEIASNVESRITAAQQKYTEWSKADEDAGKQLDVVTNLRNGLWARFARMADEFRDTAAALLKEKLSVIDAQRAQLNEGLDEIGDQRKALQEQLDRINAADDPGRILEHFIDRVSVQMIGLPFRGDDMIEQIKAVAIAHLQGARAPAAGGAAPADEGAAVAVAIAPGAGAGAVAAGAAVPGADAAVGGAVVAAIAGGGAAAAPGPGPGVPAPARAVRGAPRVAKRSSRRKQHAGK